MITTKQLRLYTAAIAVAEALEHEAQCYLDYHTIPQTIENRQALDAAKIELQACRAAYREIAAKVSADEIARASVAIHVADSFMAIQEGKDEGARFADALARYRKLHGEA